LLLFIFWYAYDVRRETNSRFVIDASRISIGCAAGNDAPRRREIDSICTVQPGFALISKSGLTLSTWSTLRSPISIADFGSKRLCVPALAQHS
jgi:hypothetical protein